VRISRLSTDASLEIHVPILSVIFLLLVEYLQAIPVALIMIIPLVCRLGITATRYYHSDSTPHSILIAPIVTDTENKECILVHNPHPGNASFDLLDTGI
jgi:hypothetical protein